MGIKEILKNIWTSERPAESISELAEGTSRSDIASVAKSSKATSKRYRVGPSLEELENAWLNDPITFNAINKNVQMIMASGYRIECDNDKDKKDFEAFIASLGQIGDDYTWDDLLEYIYKSQMVFGYAWIELLFGKKGEKVLDLTRIDPKLMDYARDATGEIVLDQKQKPIGYTQKLPSGVSNPDKNGIKYGDDVPESYKNRISLGSDKIFLSPQRISLFKLYTTGDGFDAVGLIGPAYKSILRKMNIEEAQTNSIYTRGTYPLIDYVGDEKNPPTPQRLEQASNMMKKMAHDKYFALPYYHKVVPIEVKPSDVVERVIDSMRQNQSASFGIPLPFATGTGEATNRATLGNQQMLMEYTLNDIVKKTISCMDKYLLRKIAKSRGYTSTPKIVWNKIGAEEPNEKTSRLQSWVQLGILAPEEVRPFIFDNEGLNQDDLAFNKMKEEGKLQEKVKEKSANTEKAKEE